MLIKNHIKITDVLEGYWKALLLLLVLVVALVFLNEYVIAKYIELPMSLATILGTALAFFIGFTNNQAYDRWWEGRKIWGAIVNDSRSWARQIITYSKASDTVNQDEVQEFSRQAVHRHIAWLYALKSNLRKSDDKDYRPYLSESEIADLEAQDNIHNGILKIQSQKLNDAYEKGVMDGFQFLAANDLLVRFSDEMGKCERIKNTVFPTNYHHYTYLFTWFFIVFLTFALTNQIGYWAIPASWLIGSIYAITHSIGLTLVNPFEKIKTGNPLDQIVRTIERNLLQMLGEKELPPPVEAVDGEYIL